MLQRSVAFALIALLAVAAIAAGTREKPLLIDRHSAGGWRFENVQLAEPDRVSEQPTIPRNLRTPCFIGPQSFRPDQENKT